MNNSNLEIIIETKDLVHALNFAGSIVEKRNVLSNLSNIKITAKDGIVSIGATDMDLYLNQDIGAEVIAPGETTVSTQVISDITRRIHDDRVSLKQIDADKLEIKGANCRFELLTLKAAEFPQMEDVQSDTKTNLSCAELTRLLEHTAFAMSNEETRYTLNGVYMHVKDGNFCSVATDGHRLSFASSPMNDKVDDFGVIVPRKCVNELLKILKDAKNQQLDIQLSLSTTKIKFKCNNWILISRLIDGQFPEYLPFIPKENDNKLQINTRLLAESIDRISVVNIEKFKAIKLAISTQDLKITASGEAKGVGAENIVYSDKDSNFCKYDGDDLSIGFNPNYLSDVLNSLSCKKVDVFFKDSFSPVLIKSEDNIDDIFVIMPVKV